MIIRRQRNSRFTIVPNEIAVDDRLSIEARWLMFYLLTKPDDWEVRIPDIQTTGKIGRDKAYRIVNECIDAGYIDREVDRDHSGKMLGHVYIVRDEPQRGPLPENPEMASEIRDGSDRARPLPEKPHPAEPYPANQEHTNKGSSPRTEAGGGLSANALAKRLFEAAGKALDPRSVKIELMTIPFRWLEQGFDLDLDILPVIRAESRRLIERGERVSSWAYFTGSIARQHKDRTAPIDIGGSSRSTARDPYAARISDERLKEIQAEVQGAMK